MNYCVIKNTVRDIAQSENKEKLIENALTTTVDGINVEFEILTEEEYEARKALEPVQPKEPTEIELLRLEQAQANAELFEMMLMLTGGGL